MPKRIIGVTSRLLECAKSEFLEKGFEEASIRDIAAKAETSPRAIYTRFPNKEGIFDAIVSPVTEEFIKLYVDFSTGYWDKYKDIKDVPNIAPESNQIYSKMIDYVYDHKDEFLLAIKCLNGTRFHELVEKLTTLNTNHIVSFCGARGMAVEKDDGVNNEKVTLKILNLLNHSFYTGMFEPLIHDFSREEAQLYINTLCSFFINGVMGLNFNN